MANTAPSALPAFSHLFPRTQNRGLTGLFMQMTELGHGEVSNFPTVMEVCVKCAQSFRNIY